MSGVKEGESTISPSFIQNYTRYDRWKAEGRLDLAVDATKKRDAADYGEGFWQDVRPSDIKTNQERIVITTPQGLQIAIALPTEANP